MWRKIRFVLLASKGYLNIWGIDINETEWHSIRKNACDKIFKIILNTKHDRILQYDGKKIEFLDSSFDYIFSQQVIAWK